jgi:hypothetical protein
MENTMLHLLRRWLSVIVSLGIVVGIASVVFSAPHGASASKGRLPSRLDTKKVFVVGEDYPTGILTVPSGLDDALAVGAGTNHYLVVKSDGTVAAWGLDTAGQSSVPAGLSGVTAVTGGDTFSLALKSDGTVVAWGTMSTYDAGTNTTSSVTAYVPAGLSGVTKIVASGTLAIALKSNGTIVQWGNEECLGTCAATTMPAPSNLSGVMDVAVYAIGWDKRAVALLSDYSLWMGFDSVQRRHAVRNECRREGCVGRNTRVNIPNGW